MIEVSIFESRNFNTNAVMINGFMTTIRSRSAFLGFLVGENQRSLRDSVSLVLWFALSSLKVTERRRTSLAFSMN